VLSFMPYTHSEPATLLCAVTWCRAH